MIGQFIYTIARRDTGEWTMQSNPGTREAIEARAEDAARAIDRVTHCVDIWEIVGNTGDDSYFHHIKEV